MLQSMGLQRVGHDWATEQQQQILIKACYLLVLKIRSPTQVSLGWNQDDGKTLFILESLGKNTFPWVFSALRTFLHPLTCSPLPPSPKSIMYWVPLMVPPLWFSFCLSLPPLRARDDTRAVQGLPAPTALVRVPQHSHRFREDDVDAVREGLRFCADHRMPTCPTPRVAVLSRQSASQDSLLCSPKWQEAAPYLTVICKVSDLETSPSECILRNSWRQRTAMFYLWQAVVMKIFIFKQSSKK